LQKQNYAAIASSKQTLITMIDGHKGTGNGLADRLRGMVCMYYVARTAGLDYKIHMTFPSRLENYLVPNEYDWTIKDDEIAYTTRYTLVYYPAYLDGTSKFRVSEDTVKPLASKIKKIIGTRKQLFIGSNRWLPWQYYSGLFEELFKPSPALQKLLDFQFRQIHADKPYISATFRFQELLNDFKEDAVMFSLTPLGRESLLNRCLEHLEEIHSENPDKTVLVTSDSITFLNRAKELPYTYVYAEKIYHLGVQATESGGGDPYMKSFVDYFMLANSSKVYLIVDGYMYESGFPYTAAMTHNQEYIIKRYTPDPNDIVWKKE
jgi:hypothetical protein